MTTHPPYEALSELEWAEIERIHDLLEEGEVEAARLSLTGLMRRRPGHPDLRILDATLCLEEGEATRALAALHGAERAADPAEFFYLRAAAHYELVHFPEARADCERAVAVVPGYAQAWDLLSRALEFEGEDDAAREAQDKAHALDPESFPLPLEVATEDFDRLVEQAVAELPVRVRDKLDEVPVLVQDLPSAAMLTEDEPPLTPDLLGLFVGHHIFAESSSRPAPTPGAIFLFRRNLLRACADREELAQEVRITVRHEVGHLLGLDEDELEDWGLA
jgi:predicted Zn-dependent protease with MMP-like domain